MLGDFLLELADHLFGELIPGPRTDRGHLGVSIALSVAAIGAELCVYVLVGDPVRGPDWAFRVMVAAMMAGAAAFVLSTVSLIRHREHRRLAALTAAVGAAALFCPLTLMMS
jgi:hypothetical protein